MYKTFLKNVQSMHAQKKVHKAILKHEQNLQATFTQPHALIAVLQHTC